MTARVKTLGRAIDLLVAKLTKAIDPKNLDSLVEAFVREAATTIRRRTRSGKGVANDLGSTQQLKPLSQRYIEQRKRTRRLSVFTTPRKSNLTFTGELLNSMGVERRAAGKWVITFDGTRASGITNAQLARYVSRDRPFLFIARSEFDALSKSYRRNFASLVKGKIR